MDGNGMVVIGHGGGSGSGSSGSTPSPPIPPASVMNGYGGPAGQAAGGVRAEAAAAGYGIKTEEGGVVYVDHSHSGYPQQPSYAIIDDNGGFMWATSANTSPTSAGMPSNGMPSTNGIHHPAHANGGGAPGWAMYSDERGA